MLECSLGLIFTDATGGGVNAIQIDPEVMPQPVFEVQTIEPYFQSKYFIHKGFISMTLQQISHFLIIR
jgi:hypothetical protein